MSSSLPLKNVSLTEEKNAKLRVNGRCFPAAAAVHAFDTSDGHKSCDMKGILKLHINKHKYSEI
jgi:hypothetical protein